MSELPTFTQLVAGNAPAAGQKTVTAPYDGRALAIVETAGAEATEAALSAAQAFFANQDGWLSVTERVEVLRKTAELMRAEKEALTAQAAAEGGKPYADSVVEVARAIDGLDLCVETIRSEQGHAVPMAGTAAGEHHLAVTRREPIGVVVSVSAFNHPLNLIVHQVGAAVAAGCPVIVKPADDTPLSCIRFVQLLREAGLPDAACQVLISETVELSQALVTDTRVAFFSFIGSARVGWMLRSKLAPGTRCALEHGGVAPLIVMNDADIEPALNAVNKGGFYHAGQVCVSVQRVYVERARAREFAEALAAKAEKLIVGDPNDADTEVGPLIRPAEVVRVSDWVDEAVAAGAECLTGGKALSETCYAPTVLLEPSESARVSQAEIFGPVVCVYAFDDLDDAIARANALPVAFQAAIYTDDINTAMHAYSRLAASAVMVNQHTAFRVDGMPFAGLRESGLGVGGIPHTIADMSVEKMLVIRSDQL